MSWRHGTCECCGEDCELVSVTTTCTEIGVGSCQDANGCGPIQVTFGTPDTVSGRTHISNHFNYPFEPDGNFKWKGGTRLTIRVDPKFITCDGVLYFFRHMTIEYGCPSDPASVFVQGRWAAIDLPLCPDGQCTISITANYFASVAGVDCGDCLDDIGECATIVTFDDVLNPWDNTEAGVHECFDPNGPGQMIICEVGGDDCVDVFPCETYRARVEACYAQARDGLDSSLPIRYNGGCGLATEIQCANYGGGGLCESGQCDTVPPNQNDFINYSVDASINRFFACQLIVTDPGQLATGVIHGYIEATGDAVMAAAISFQTSDVPIGGCTEIGTMGGTYRFPPTDPDTTNLGTFNPALNGDFCRAMIEILSRHYTLTNAIPGRPGWGVTVG